MRTITRVDTDQQVAALTFDDGPDPVSTPSVLAVLEKHRAKGTFFMVGESAARYPELVERVAAGGHAIGNHTWSHPSLPVATGRERRREIRRCHRALRPFGGRLFRPPFGHQTFASWLDAFCQGYRVVTWSVLAEDWLAHPAEHMADRLLDRIRPGSIVLLHDALYVTVNDTYKDRTAMLDALDTVLGMLGGSFRFVTIPELLRCGRPRHANWVRPTDAALMAALVPRA